MRFFPVLVAAAAIALPGLACADRVRTAAEACAVLANAVPRYAGLREAPNDYYCEAHKTSRRYYVFAFRFRHPEPPSTGPDWLGSNLVGWFGVRRVDGAILDWDMAKNLPGALISATKGRDKKRGAEVQ